MKEKIKILIVDDDPDILFATSRILKSEEYDVFAAGSGKECMVRAKKHFPDLILLDVVLPDVDGYKLCRRLKKDPDLKGVYIIMLSAMKTSSDDQAKGLNDGADGYIARPVSNSELKARVRSMVRILKAERERDRLIKELKKALEEIETLTGLLPICCHCKKVRDDKGYWNEIEKYLKKHSKAELTHGICPDCLDKLYPGPDTEES